MKSALIAEVVESLKADCPGDAFHATNKSHAELIANRYMDYCAKLINAMRPKTPCGECHLQPGEICDICSAEQPDIRTQPPECSGCGATTVEACNAAGCFYLESGNGEPDIRRPPSMWTATIPTTPKPSSVSADYVTEEQARQAFQASNIRDQILPFVPPVSEWPEGANYIAADEDRGSWWFFDEEPIVSSGGGTFMRKIGTNCQIACSWLPPELKEYWQQSLFHINDVKAARGG